MRLCDCGAAARYDAYCVACLVDEFDIICTGLASEDLGLYDDLFRAAVECDGDLKWLRAYVKDRFDRYREVHNVIWQHLPADVGIPVVAIQSVIEMLVEEVERLNPEHPLVNAWEW